MEQNEREGWSEKKGRDRERKEEGGGENASNIEGDREEGMMERERKQKRHRKREREREHKRDIERESEREECERLKRVHILDMNNNIRKPIQHQK